VPLANNYRCYFSFKDDAHPSRVEAAFRGFCNLFPHSDKAFAICVTTGNVSNAFFEGLYLSTCLLKPSTETSNTFPLEFNENKKGKWKNCVLITRTSIFTDTVLPILRYPRATKQR